MVGERVGVEVGAGEVEADGFSEKSDCIVVLTPHGKPDRLVRGFDRVTPTECHSPMRSVSLATWKEPGFRQSPRAGGGAQQAPPRTRRRPYLRGNLTVRSTSRTTRPGLGEGRVVSGSDVRGRPLICRAQCAAFRLAEPANG